MSIEKKPSNPFAFPNTDGTTFCTDGMTLRDYFANSAMQGMLSNTAMFDLLNGNANEIASRLSYELADAMLKQREL